MAWTFAAFAPHPPIIDPQVGRGREQEAAATLHGMDMLRQHISAIMQKRGVPDVLLVLSPHHPYAPGTLFCNNAPTMHGSLAPFGAPGAALNLQTPPAQLAALLQHLQGAGIPVSTGKMEDITRDHGAIVPLLQLAPCFPKGTLPPVILAGPVGLSYPQALTLGQALATLQGPGNWGLIASGDLSHALTPNAPSGFSPCGKTLDDAMVQALKTGDPKPLLHLPAPTVQQAGECGLRSALTMLGLINGPANVLSYEGPFGVGYATAVWPV